MHWKKISVLLFAASLCSDPLTAAEPLSGTQPLDVAADFDFAAEMVAGIDRYLTRALADSVQRRQADWKPDASSADAYQRWLTPKRDRLRQIIGAVDPRVPNPALEYITTASSAPVTSGTGYVIHTVRWPVLDGVDAEGLLLEPEGAPIAQIVAIPDADNTPEQLVGLQPGLPPAAQFARRLAENGCRVLVPLIIDRTDTYAGHPSARFTNQPHREFIYRSAYQMGRHVIGYEVQKVLSAIDWFATAPDHENKKVGIIGYGEGGLLALYAAAIDPRIDAVVISGYLQPRENLWQEPIYRNVWALLTEFGDAELLNMILPRTAIVEAVPHPAVDGPPKSRDGRSGAAPGRIKTPPIDAVRAEIDRAKTLAAKSDFAKNLHLVAPPQGHPGSDQTLTVFLRALGSQATLKPLSEPPVAAPFDPQPRLKRQVNQLVEYTQTLVRQSARARRKFWSQADGTSVEKWVESTRPYRDYFRNEIIGRIDAAALRPNVRTRQIDDNAKYRAYDVVLDVLPDVFASGILLVPKHLKPGERRPVVVCQHGLEGTAQDTISSEGQAFHYYQSFSARLAERGFIVYAPQNPYRGGDQFRVLQRKANPLKKSLYSFILRQYEQTLDWLAAQPFVDPDRIGYYGLSYGGKTAMWVPPVLNDRFALTICSANFGEWIWKTTSVTQPFSYILVGEYEMFEFNLGNTFNHAELAGLIAPRPFMVERGHHDGVAPDEWVAYEYAKVRLRYAELGIPDRTEIEYFMGPHQIHGVGTFDFLHKHLHWPTP